MRPESGYAARVLIMQPEAGYAARRRICGANPQKLKNKGQQQDTYDRKGNYKDQSFELAFGFCGPVYAAGGNGGDNSCNKKKKRQISNLHNFIYITIIT